MSHPLYDLLTRLDKARFHYTLERNSEESITVIVYFVGERTEVDVFDDGHMEVSRFLGTEDVLGGQERIYQIIDNNLFENKMYEEHFNEYRDNEKDENRG